MRRFLLEGRLAPVVGDAVGMYIAFLASSTPLVEKCVIALWLRQAYWFDQYNALGAEPFDWGEL